jgi:hypothetical protein
LRLPYVNYSDKPLTGSNLRRDSIIIL